MVDKVIGAVSGVALVLILILLGLSIVNGIRYTYYWQAGKVHYVSLDNGTQCIKTYDFFTKDVECYEKGE